MSFFKVLNLPENFDLDRKKLHERYLELQAKYHPDKANNMEDKNNCIIMSSYINVAYEVLNNDLTRAEHLLELKDIDINNIKLSKQQLEIEMNNREILEKILDINELNELYNKNAQNKVILIDKLKQAFNEDYLEKVLDIIVSLKYLDRLLEEIKLKIDYANSRDQ